MSDFALCRRIDYLERLVPAVTRVQRIWRTVRERAFVADMHWLCIRVQSHVRRVLLIRERKKLQPLKDLFFGAVITAGIAYSFRRLGLSDEVVHSIEMKWAPLYIQQQCNTSLALRLVNGFAIMSSVSSRHSLELVWDGR